MDFQDALKTNILTRAVHEIPVEGRILADIIPVLPNMEALAGLGGGDVASWDKDEITQAMATLSIEGKTPVPVAKNSLSVKQETILHSKESTNLKAKDMMLAQDPRTGQPFRDRLISRTLVNLRNRSIIRTNAALAEALRAGTITNTAPPVSIDFGIPAGNIITLSGDDIFGEVEADLISLADKSMVDLIDTVETASLLSVGVIVSNWYTYAIYLNNRGLTSSALQAAKDLMREQGMVEVEGRLFKWVIENRNYYNGSSTVKYFPNGYIIAIAGVGPAKGEANPVWIEQGRPDVLPEIMADIEDNNNRIGFVAWSNIDKRASSKEIIVSTREIPILGKEEAVGSMYVLS